MVVAPVAMAMYEDASAGGGAAAPPVIHDPRVPSRQRWPLCGPQPRPHTRQLPSPPWLDEHSGPHPPGAGSLSTAEPSPRVQ